MAYGGNPSTDNSDAVRLLVGDISTSTSGEFLTDADYDFFVAQGGNIFIAAQLAANSLAHLFMGSGASASGGGYTEKAVGDLRLKKSDAVQVAAQYRALSAKFGRMAAARITPSAGGITAADGSTIAPFFRRKLMENPYATQPNVGADADDDPEIA